MGSLKKLFVRKNGFGIAEVLVSAAVLGFFCIALNRLQVGNHDAFLRIRGRDGAVEVAQRTMEILKAQGVTAIPSKESSDTTYSMPDTTIAWERGLGGKAPITYSRSITVSPVSGYVAENKSNYETIQHVYAKQVNVKVSWKFKGSTQSINVTGVVR